MCVVHFHCYIMYRRKTTSVEYYILRITYGETVYIPTHYVAVFYNKLKFVLCLLLKLVPDCNSIPTQWFIMCFCTCWCCFFRLLWNFNLSSIKETVAFMITMELQCSKILNKSGLMSEKCCINRIGDLTCTVSDTQFSDWEYWNTSDT